MRAVDTNVLIRLATRDDDRQVAAAEAYIAARAAWVSHVVLVEFAWALESVYEFDRERIAAALEVLLAQEHLAVQEPDTAVAAVELYRAGGGTDFGDCLILEIARRNGHVPLGTFDRKLSKLAGAERI